MQRYRHIDRGVDLRTLKSSQDPLFAVTVYEIAGLFYSTHVPVLAFCSNGRPFSELTLSAMARQERIEITDDLVSCLRKLQGRTPVRPDPDTRMFPEFLRRIQTKPRHANAQIHLLMEQYWDRDAVSSLAGERPLTGQQGIQLHHAPWGPHGRWNDMVERWLTEIGSWPMQTSFVESANQMREILRQPPTDRLQKTLLIC
jgi:hypothetical protein